MLFRSVSMSGRAVSIRAIVRRRSEVWYIQIKFSSSTLKFMCQTSISFVFSRGGVCLLCSFFAASNCARMDGFFGLAVRDFLAFGAFSSFLTAAARSVKEICSPAFALASNSPREGALFRTPSIMFSFCSVESSAVRSGFSRKNSRSEERRVGKECRSRWSPYH